MAREIVSKHGFITTDIRSKTMQRIRHKNTKPEVAFRKALWHLGIRYRIDYNKVTGKPDIAIVNKKIAIFVDGEFWHGYDWERKKDKIKNNREYWITKIERNIRRDLEVNQALNIMEWKVLRFWEHDVKNNLDECISTVFKYLK